jgi:hypothetical protein
VIDAATPPSSPISPRIEVIAPLAAVGGLLGGLALVMVLELAGDPAGSVTEVRRAARAPTLSVAPVGRRSDGARGGEVVATHLALVRPGIGSVLLTGTAGTDGGGGLALELAAAWAAEPGRGRVVVVDAGTGETTAVMGLDGRAGLAEVLAGEEVASTPLAGGVEVLGRGAGRTPPGPTPGAPARIVDDLVADGARGGGARPAGGDRAGHAGLGPRRGHDRPGRPAGHRAAGPAGRHGRRPPAGSAPTSPSPCSTPAGGRGAPLAVVAPRARAARPVEAVA